MKKAIRCAVVGLIGFAVYPVASYLVPPVSIGFWTLAFSSRIDFNNTAGVARYFAVERSPMAHTSFRLMFYVGTKAGKLYALAGVRDTGSQSELSDYIQRLRAIGGEVGFRAGDTETYGPVESWIAPIRENDFPMYRHLKAANQALERNDPSRHASCYAPVAPTGIVAHL